MTTRQFEKYEIEGQTFNIRFDSESSMFFCLAFDKKFENESIKLLRQTLTDEYNQIKKTTWESVIEITITTESYSYQYSCGFNSEIKFIGTVITPDGKEKRIIAHAKTKEIFDDKKDISNYQPTRPFSEYFQEERIRHIPYSLKKFESLKYIESQMKRLKSQVQDMLSSANCEAFLETVSNNTLPQLEYKPNEERGKDE